MKQLSLLTLWVLLVTPYAFAAVECENVEGVQKVQQKESQDQESAPAKLNQDGTAQILLPETPASESNTSEKE